MNFFYRRVFLSIYRCSYNANVSRISSRKVNKISPILPVRTLSLSSNFFVKIKFVGKDLTPKTRRDLWVYEAVFKEAHELSKEKWDEIIEHGLQSTPQLDQCITSVMRECVIKKNFKLASSLASYVKNKNLEPSTGFLSLLLELYGHADQECEEDVILEVYQELDKRLPVKSEKLLIKMINGLCRTSQFHLVYPHLQALKSLGVVPNEVKHNLVVGAFRSGHVADAWKFLDEALPDTNAPLLLPVVSAFVFYCNTLNQDDREAAVLRFLQQLQKSQVFLDTASLDVLEPFMVRTGWIISPASMNPASGACRACGADVNFSPISPDTFARVTDAFLENVLKRGDIYLSSNPEELQGFERFLQTNCPFTHVLDGLNIAFKSVRASDSRIKKSSVSKVMIQNLLSVVQKIVAEQPAAKPLVMCRVHMLSWDRTSFDKLREISSVYLVQDLSFDDSFFLYAALRSGIETQIITSDLLRNHAILLKDAELQRVFKLWQQRAQRKIICANPVKIEYPSTFSTTCQPSSADGRSWHIPYDDGTLEMSHYLPRTWLCAKWRGWAECTADSAGSAPSLQGQVLSTDEKPRTTCMTSNFTGLDTTSRKPEISKSVEKTIIGDELLKTETNRSSRPRYPEGDSLEPLPGQNFDHEEKFQTDDAFVTNSGISRQNSLHLKSSTILSDKLIRLLSSRSTSSNNTNNGQK